jgi:cyanophycinase
MISALRAGAAFGASAEADPGYSYYAIGDVQAQRPGRVEPALLLSGGGTWQPDAFRWFAAKAGHGHIVVIGASGDGEDGARLFRDIGGVQSVETVIFRSRKASFDARVLAALAHADAVFILGGDQSKYVRFWKGTPVAKAIDAEIARGKPVGGTSAGLAILGATGYGAMDGGSIDSATALRDPAGPAVTIVRNFLHMPFLAHVVTDTHFTARNRLGRLIAFVAQVRSTIDANAVGLGVDQDSALCVDASGHGRLFTNDHGFGWLVQPASKARVVPGKPLEFPLIRITGVGPRSRINLKTMSVEQPAFSILMSVHSGVLTTVSERR